MGEDLSQYFKVCIFWIQDLSSLVLQNFLSLAYESFQYPLVTIHFLCAYTELINTKQNKAINDSGLCFLFSDWVYILR